MRGRLRRIEIGELGEAGFDLSLTGFDEFEPHRAAAVRPRSPKRQGHRRHLLLDRREIKVILAMRVADIENCKSAFRQAFVSRRASSSDR